MAGHVHVCVLMVWMNYSFYGVVLLQQPIRVGLLDGSMPSRYILYKL